MCATCEFLIHEITERRNELDALPCRMKAPTRIAELKRQLAELKAKQDRHPPGYYKEYYQRHRLKKNQAARDRYYAKKMLSGQSGSNLTAE